MKILAAPWVLPVDRPPIPDGAILLDDGLVVEVGTRRDLLTKSAGVDVERVEGAALLPALVNGHAHLELTGLGALAPGLDFVGWILGVIALKRKSSLEEHRRSLANGLAACWSGGQGAVADIVSVGGLGGAYPCAGPHVLALPEVICTDDAFAEGVVHNAAAAPLHGRACRAGLFAHAPYTVSAEAYRTAHALVTRGGGRFYTHLAESPDEVEFCRGGSGAIPERLYAELPVGPPPAPGCHPVEHLDRLGVLGPESVAVHLVQVTREHVALLRRRKVSAILCPRSNRNLGVGDAPGRALLDAGLIVGLGTDSALSAGDLDLFKDAALAVDAYGWSPEEAIRAATQGSARALGLEGKAGAFAPGLRADILAMRLQAGREPFGEILARPTIEKFWHGGELAPPPGAIFALDEGGGDPCGEMV